jgi:hypothetical protein
MPIAATLAALVITLTIQPDVPLAIVDHALAEVDAIWRPIGVSTIWNRAVSRAPASLHVVIGAARGLNKDDADPPLGWIVFEAGQPQPEIYVSYPNAVALLARSSGVVGPRQSMPIVQNETYLGRAMGRALAHELGHYLLAAATHTTRGLMKARPTAFELFSPSLAAFAITPDEGTRALSRLNAELLAAHSAGSSSPSDAATESDTPNRAFRSQGALPPTEVPWPHPIPRLRNEPAQPE